MPRADKKRHMSSNPSLFLSDSESRLIMTWVCLISFHLRSVASSLKSKFSVSCCLSIVAGTASHCFLFFHFLNPKAHSSASSPPPLKKPWNKHMRGFISVATDTYTMKLRRIVGFYNETCYFLWITSIFKCFLFFIIVGLQQRYFTHKESQNKRSSSMLAMTMIIRFF